MELVFSKDGTGTGETETIGFYIPYEDRICSLVFPAKVHTEAGDRLVSIHPKLLKLGCLDYVGPIRNEKHQKLFPSLKKMRGTGYGTLISRWLARYLKKLGIKKKGQNFHSFRHTVVNRLTTKAGIPTIHQRINRSFSWIFNSGSIWRQKTIRSIVE